jgi:hypothetical protein
MVIDDHLAPEDQESTKVAGGLMLLAPEILEAILEGRQPVEMTLAALIKPCPLVYQHQVRAYLRGNSANHSSLSAAA